MAWSDPANQNGYAGARTRPTGASESGCICRAVPSGKLRDVFRGFDNRRCEMTERRAESGDRERPFSDKETRGAAGRPREAVRSENSALAEQWGSACGRGVLGWLGLMPLPRWIEPQLSKLATRC
jgi:hypothetical protein